MVVLHKSLGRIGTLSVIFLVPLLLLFNCHENDKSCRKNILDIKCVYFFSTTLAQNSFHFNKYLVSCT
jgi:hypothetical protein